MPLRLAWILLERAASLVREACRLTLDYGVVTEQRYFGER